MKELTRTDFPMLSDNEFKLLANTRATKCNRFGITNLPYNGDGFSSNADRILGYKNLRDKGYIDFEDKDIVSENVLLPQYIILLIDC